MAAGDTHVLDSLDTVHHEMDSVGCSHHVYKSQCEVASNRRTTLPGEEA